MLLSSVSNPTVKFAASLDQRKVRRETNLFLAEGEDYFAVAQKRTWYPQTVFYTNISALVQWAKAGKAQCFEANAAVMAKLSAMENPQSVIGVFEQRWATLTNILSGLWLVLENVRDPGNLGTIIRTCDAVGVDGIVLVGQCCDPYAREVVRASMGSIFAVPLVKANFDDFSAFIQTRAWPIIGTHLDGNVDFRRLPKIPDAFVIMGSESGGMSEKMSLLCTHLARIPMVGFTESLNVATATALILYELKREELR